jgi:CubicO group peptidase (beta-lactamase class C family)
MTKNQLPKGIFAYGYFGFGLGFQVQLHDWKDKGHVGEYGWNGAASTHFWISPTDELIVILLSQRQPYSDALKKKIKPLIYAHIQE